VFRADFNKKSNVLLADLSLNHSLKRKLRENARLRRKKKNCCVILWRPFAAHSESRVFLLGHSAS
jgi:hypothetical protein